MRQPTQIQHFIAARFVMWLQHICTDFYLYINWHVLRPLLFWDVKQCWLVVTNIFGWTVRSNTTGQAWPLDQWRWDWEVFPNCWKPTKKQGCIISQKSEGLTYTTVEACNHTHRMCSLYSHYTTRIVCFQIANTVYAQFTILKHIHKS
jgi:hypothetical protein